MILTIIFILPSIILCANVIGAFILLHKSLKWIDEGLSDKEICRKQIKYAIFLCPLMLPFLEK